MLRNIYLSNEDSAVALSSNETHLQTKINTHLLLICQIRHFCWFSDMFHIFIHIYIKKGIIEKKRKENEKKSCVIFETLFLLACRKYIAKMNRYFLNKAFLIRTKKKIRIDNWVITTIDKIYYIFIDLKQRNWK